MYKYLKFNKRVDRRSPSNEGDIESPISRENWLSRDGKLAEPGGTEIMDYHESYGFDTYTKFLAHFGDTFKDELGAVPTIYEDAVIDRTDGAFGNVGCGKFDGTNDVVTYPDSADYAFGTANFTVDFRIKFSDLGLQQIIIEQRASGADFWRILKTSNATGNKLDLRFFIGSVDKGHYTMTSNWGLITDRWYHVELARIGTTAILLIDGEVHALTETVAFGTNDTGNVAATLNIGGRLVSDKLNGKLDEVRISKGIARHTAAFTPITEEYAPDSGLGGLSSYPTWMYRYYTKEIGQQSPKTFAYTQDGKLWVVDDISKTVTLIKEGLNPTAYPKAWVCKQTEQFTLYMVDGKNLYAYDGNNDNKFEIVEVIATDKNDNSYTLEPIDLIEHRERLFVVDRTFIAVSANLSFSDFNNATDSIALIPGSGQSEIKGCAKIEDKLFFGTTEGVFALTGDVISALAPTFELRLVEEQKVLTSVFKTVEKGIIFWSYDLELYAFNGYSAEMLSYKEKLKDFVNPDLDMLNKMVSVWEDDYFKCSFVETGSDGFPRLEIWWDTFKNDGENNIDFVRGRNVGCYLQNIDPTREKAYAQIGRSDIPNMMWVDRGNTFGGVAIENILWTRDITVEKGRNVRFLAFYPEFQPSGNRTVTFEYFLDGRYGIPRQTPVGVNTGLLPAQFSHSLRSEYDVGQQAGTTANVVRYELQNQFIGRIRPKILYSRGTSISFLIIEKTSEQRTTFLGMGLEWTLRPRKKSQKVGA